MLPDSEPWRERAEKFNRKFDEELGDEYIRLSEYSGSNKPLLVVHVPCGHLRYCVEARDVFRKGCWYCKYSENRKKRMMGAASAHIEEIEKTYDVTAISQYSGSKFPMFWRCNKCGAVLEKSIDNILWRSGEYSVGLVCDCTLNGPCGRVSQGEYEILSHLRRRKIQYRREVKFPGLVMQKPLAFDFVLYADGMTPTCAIEFNGIQHYEVVWQFGGEEYLERVQSSDRIKREWCRDHELPLLVIRYDDDLIKSLDDFLNSLGLIAGPSPSAS